MPGTSPIKLGSATSGWTFESGSNVEESASGIQTVSVKALWPDGDTVLSNLPAAGASASMIDPSGFIPSSFLLDYTDKGPAIDYLEGRIARATFPFKRQDPNRTGPTASRNVTVDSVLNYKSVLTPFFNYALAADGVTDQGVFGFPEPVCTVKYNSTTNPGIGGGSLATLYALPGSAAASGFPDVPVIFAPFSVVAAVGAVFTYFNGTAYVTAGPIAVQTTINYALNFVANARGWQLTKLKAEPVANRSFFDVEETWRNFYNFTGVTFINSIPAIP